jgi:GntR family transcriptional regulator
MLMISRWSTPTRSTACNCSTLAADAERRFDPSLSDISLWYGLSMELDKQSKSSDEPPPVSSIVFRLDLRSGVPTYLQLVHQVEHALRLGYLIQGDQLPRVKDVVGSLSINPNTVLKAYRDLEQKGLISARPGLGTFILASPETVGLEELTALRRSLVAGFLSDASAAGLDEDGIVALFMVALRDFRDRPAERRPARRGGKGRAEGAA